MYQMQEMYQLCSGMVIEFGRDGYPEMRPFDSIGDLCYFYMSNSIPDLSRYPLPSELYFFKLFL